MTMLSMLLSVAAAGTATLHVGIVRAAGAIHDIAADGAAGQCSIVGTTHIVCPAQGPVTFRWGPGGDWAFSGDQLVEVDEVGVAWVLAPDQLDRERLAALEIPTLEVVRTTFLRTGANPLGPPSRALVRRLVELAEHPDWRIRRVVTRSLMRYLRHTAADLFPAGAPSLVPPGLLVRLATDENVRVRRSAGRLVRELSRDDALTIERREVLAEMKRDQNRGVRRLAVVVERQQAIEGEEEALEAWNGALSRVPRSGAPGRAAATSLVVLKGRVDTERVDVEDALSIVLRHHPEKAWRVWAAWRDELPFDRVKAEFLLRETVGLSQPLLNQWATVQPDRLADLLQRWEPEAPHSERWRVIGRWVDRKADNERLRRVLGLPDKLSDPSGSSQTE